MNTGKMQGVMAARGTAPGSQQTQNSTQAAIMKEIVRSLSSQPTIPGWRAAMGLPPRAGNIRQLWVTSPLNTSVTERAVQGVSLAWQHSHPLSTYVLVTHLSVHRISSLVLLKQMSAEKVLPLALALEQETFQNSADVVSHVLPSTDLSRRYLPSL